MSFISKLFRKAEAEEEAPAKPVAEAPETPTANTAMPEANTPASENPSQPTKDSPAEEEWWASSTAAENSSAEDEPPSNLTADTPIGNVIPSLPASGGTRPLAPEPLPDEESGTRLLEESGTRPLTGADAPMLATVHSARGLAFAALRDIGRVRSINQDSIFAMLTTLPREGNDLPLGLFIVADGMGGHQGGEVASRLAISTVAQQIMAELIVPALDDSSTEALQPLLIAAVQAANRKIWEQAQLLGTDMGTTCTVVLMLGHALYLGHVGDSRAYLATPTGLRLLTNDHSTVGRLIQVGQLDPAEAREHPLRSQLYRTVGQQPDVLVDFSYQQLGDGTHILLASDGLWGMLDDEVLFDVIVHHSWPHDACNELIARANLAGGDDNISAILVSLPSGTH